jgi:hypothetical protein
MSRQFWSETISWATASGAAIANTATETIIFPNITIPANYLQDGRALRLRIWGSYGTTATPTLAFALRWGGVSGTVLAKSTAVTTTSAVGGGASMTAPFDLEIYIQTRSNGSTGTLMSNGHATLFTSTAVTAGTVTNYGMPVPIASGSTGGTTPVGVTVDLTSDTALSITATWGTANAANSIQGLQYSLEALN